MGGDNARVNRQAAIDDLFGQVPQRSAAPPDVTATTDAPPSEHVSDYPPVPPGGHTPDTIRPIMLRLLAEARATTVLDWSPQRLRSLTAMFPYMAEWLKGGEGDRLLHAFKAEMDRLDAPADQVAPNWRRIWGLAA